MGARSPSTLLWGCGSGWSGILGHILLEFSRGEDVTKIWRSAVGYGEFVDGNWEALSIFKLGEGCFVWWCPEVLPP